MMGRCKTWLATALLAVATSAAWAAPKPFSAAAAEAAAPAPGVWSFPVAAPEPGNYRMVVYAAAEQPLAKGAEVTVVREDGVRKVRRVIAPGAKAGRVDAVRVVFPENGERKAIRVESPDAAVTRLDFVPISTAEVPIEALAYQPRVVPPAEHPRVLVNPAMLPELRKHVKTGENLPVWEKVLKTANTPYPFNPAPEQEVRYDANLLTAARSKAFVCLIDGDEECGLEAISLVRRYLERVDYGLAQDISREIGEGLFTAAMVYDWCYKLLTPEDKASFLKSFYYFAYEMEIGWPPFKEPALYGHANESQISRDLLAAAIAVYDEDPLPYRYVSYCLLEVSAPAKNFLYRSGRHDQGTSYGNYRFAWDLHAALLFRRMAHYELFSADAARVPYRWIYLRTPDGKLFKEGDDFFTVGEYPGNRPMNLVAAALYGDPMMKSEFRRITSAEVIDPVFFLLVNDPALKAEDRRAELPLSCYYPSPLGAMVARTGWNFGLNADDVIVSMLGAGYQYRNHQHLDAGSFQIYYRGPLLADLGLYRGYGSSYDWNFHKSTVSHTAMLIRDPEQKGYPMGPRFSANSGTQETTDFFPAASLSSQLNGDFYRSGEVTARGFGPDAMRPEYTFLKADLAPSYRSRVDRYSRTMIFLNLGRKEAPAALIVSDSLALKAERIEPIFQLTGPARPAVDGSRMRFVNAPYGRPGSLAVELLLPKKVDVSLLSGRDVFTIDGKPYVPGAFYDFDNAGTRTMVTAAAGADKSEFLSVMQLLPGDAAALPVAWEEKDGRLEVRLADRTVNFEKNGSDRAAQIAFRVLPGFGRVLLLDLKPGLWTLAGPVGTTPVTVDGEAKSFFSLLEPGDYTLTPGVAAWGKATATPPPAKNALEFDGKAIAAPAGNRLLPMTALLKAKGIQYAETDNTLSFPCGGETVTLKSDEAVAKIGDFTWPLPEKIVRNSSGEWLVPADAAAALSGAVAYPDAHTGSLLLKSEPEGRFLSLTCPAGDAEAWRRLWNTTRGKWVADGRGIACELVLRQPEQLAGIELMRNDSDLHRSHYRVDVSENGTSWDKVYDGDTQVDQIVYERVSFPARPVRMIRITFNGNTENSLNGVLGARLVPARDRK